MERTRIKPLIFKSLLILTLLPSPSIAADGILKISSGIRAPLSNTEQTGFNDLITREAFKRVGYEIEILQLPAARALDDLNRGLIDGDLVRFGGIREAFENIRVVPEKIIDFDFVAISHRMAFEPKGWESLLPYEVGMVAGWRILEKNVKSLISVTKVEDTRHLVNILNNDRIDLAVSERWQAKQAIKTLGSNTLKIHEPPIKSNAMFMVVHKKHESLIPKLVLALQAMKQDGSFDRIYATALRSLKDD